MAKKKKKKGIDSIDDFFADMRDTKHGELGDSFKHYTEKTDSKVLNALAVQNIQPGVDNFYSTFTAELDAIQGLSDDTYIKSKHKKKVRKAAIKALEAFFEKTRPGVVEAVKGIKSTKEKYKRLVREYNQHVGADPQNGEGIDQIIDNYVGNKAKTMAELKMDLYQRKANHVIGSIKSLKSQAYNHFLGTYHDLELADHVKERAKKKKYKIVDEARFMDMAGPQYANLYNALKTGDFGEGGMKAYHLKQKKEKKGK